MLFIDTMNMDNKFKSKSLEILAKCQKQTNPDCLIYTGRASPSQTYPKIKITHEKSKYYQNMHVFIYKVHHNILPYAKSAHNIEISHLCHNHLCLNVHHLNMESRSMNNIRKNCNRFKQCSGHNDNPDCIFVSGTIYIYLF